MKDRLNEKRYDKSDIMHINDFNKNAPAWNWPTNTFVKSESLTGIHFRDTRLPYPFLCYVNIGAWWKFANKYSLSADPLENERTFAWNETRAWTNLSNPVRDIIHRCDWYSLFARYIITVCLGLMIHWTYMCHSTCTSYANCIINTIKITFMALSRVRDVTTQNIRKYSTRRI